VSATASEKARIVRAKGASEVPVLAHRANRDAMSDSRVIEPASRRAPGVIEARSWRAADLVATSDSRGPS
jgi:hypothetical protein